MRTCSLHSTVPSHTLDLPFVCIFSFPIVFSFRLFLSLSLLTIFVCAVSGTKGQSDEIALRSKSDAFERNAIDHVKFESDPIGRPIKLRVWHDGTGRNAGWKLSRIVLESPKGKLVCFHIYVVSSCHDISYGFFECVYVK